MELTEINLRKVTLEIKAHGERFADSTWHSNATVETQSRVIFILDGHMFFYIDSKKYIAGKNELVLIPEKRHVEYGVPKNELVHCLYCNFSAEFGDGSIWDHLSGKWICTAEDPDRTENLFRRFSSTDNENLILDFIDKKLCLASILSDFLRNAKLEQKKKKTNSSIDLNGIADLIKRNAHSTDTIDLGYLAEIAHVHPSYLTRAFKKQYGTSPMQFVLEARTDAAKKLLSDKNMTISDVAETMHFENPKYFSKFFKRRTGMTPSEFRKQLDKHQ